ncbi:hypothetical protein IM538_04950 [Cytobacillus suaedae]|nr:hypothetical protein IM538_04950 [Cytobacillus suaedae]
MNQQFPIHAYDTRTLRRPYIRPRRPLGYGYGGFGGPLVGGVLGGLLGSTLLNPYFYGPTPFYPPYPYGFGYGYGYPGFWW